MTHRKPTPFTGWEDVTIENELSKMPADMQLRVKNRLGIYALRKRKGLIARLLLFFAILGPGILVMIADNDAGGVITYSQTGSIFGIGFFIPFMILMIPVAFLVQEMTVRLAAVTGRGHAELIWRRYGKWWGSFSLIDLLAANVLTLITEFIGIIFGMALLGISTIYAVGMGLAIILSITLLLRYHTWERISIIIAGLNIIFIPIMFVAHPNFGAVAASFFSWNIPGGISSFFIYLLLANIGTTIAPWMLFFQQSSEVDKGTTLHDMKDAKRDTILGAIIMAAVAISIIIFTASLVYNSAIPIAKSSSAYTIQYIINSISSKVGSLPIDLFALGIIDAGLITSIVLVASTSWAVSEAFKIPKSINLPFMKAKKFYLPGVFALILAAFIVLIPNIPLGFVNITVQVIASIMMPSALVFLLFLVNDKHIIGKYANSKKRNLLVGALISFLILMSLIYTISLIFPGFI